MPQRTFRAKATESQEKAQHNVRLLIPDNERLLEACKEDAEAAGLKDPFKPSEWILAAILWVLDGCPKDDDDDDDGDGEVEYDDAA